MTTTQKNAAAKPLTYAQRIRTAMRTSENPTKAPMTLAQLARLTGYSYEHCRKHVNVGHFVGSQTFNDTLCEALGLDADAMWQLAQEEKLRRRYGAGLLSAVPSDDRLVAGWAQLSDDERERVLRVIEGIVLEGQVLQAPVTTCPSTLSSQQQPTPAEALPLVDLPATPPAPAARRSTESRWLSMEATSEYLGMPSAHAARQWVKKQGIPVSQDGTDRVHRENVDRALAGLAPLPLTAFVKR